MGYHRDKSEPSINPCDGADSFGCPLYFSRCYADISNNSELLKEDVR